MAETTNKNTTATTTAGTAANTTNGTTTKGGVSSGNGQVNTGAYDTARTDAINQMYDAQKRSNLTELQSTYDQSLNEYKAAQDKIAPTYQESANDLSTQYEKSRQAFQRQAMANGLNTGTGAQESLARYGQYQRDLGDLRGKEADAISANQLQQTNLTAKYQSDVAAALANNDYQRAGALLDEYNNGYNRQMQEAEQLAAYGDFSGYAALYGDDTADSMSDLWNAQNPDLAYNTGRITAEQYKAMTGSYPVGYTATGGGGGGGGYSAWDGYGGGSKKSADKTPAGTKDTSSAGIPRATAEKIAQAATSASSGLAATPTAINSMDKLNYK